MGAVVALVHERGLGRVELDERQQALKARRGIVLDDDAGVADPVVVLDREPDLVELDAEAAELDLVVGAPDKLDGAVGVAAHQVAGLVEPVMARVVGERGGDEPVRGQVGAVQVAARELHAADVELADVALGDRLARRREDVKRRAVDRRADRDRVRAVERGKIDGERRGVDRALGRPVEVDELAPFERVRHLPREAAREGLAAAEDLPQRGRAMQRLGVDERLQQRRDAPAS